MEREEAVKHMTDVMAKFVAFTGKRLPDDVRAKIEELAQQEEEPLAKAIYKTMARNQELAVKLNRPSCQDTGALQFFVKCGTAFPYMADLPELLRQAVVQATKDAPLRHNAVETFDEYNTGKNVAKNIPSLFPPIKALHFYDILLFIYRLYYYICKNNSIKPAYDPVKYFRIVNIHRWDNWND